MIAVPAEATPRRQTRASHARVPTLTPRPDRPAAQDDRPYGLAVERRPTRIARAVYESDETRPPETTARGSTNQL
jgi:hypothetical protein